ncbi:MAG: helix-turn-helix domain-containing protein, partial [Acetanaerobacterium sp.]
MDHTAFKHSFKTRLRESFGLAVYNTGRQQCEPSYTWGPAVRDHYLIHYVALGSGTLRADGRQYDIRAGDAFLVTPGRLVSYTANPHDPWEYLWVGFNGSDAQGLLALTGFCAENPIVHLLDDAKTRCLLGDIYAAQGCAAHQETRMSGYLYLFLAYLMDCAKKPLQEADAARAYAELALRYIEHNYGMHIGVDDIASHVGISRSHLYRVFIRHIALSPNEYVVRFRVSKACELLHGTPLSVAEVAGSVGFDDPLYFSRVFRRIKGVSPRAYRKDT